MRIRGYTTFSPRRGQCGHLHKTRVHAQKCAVEEGRSAYSVAGFDDRRMVVPVGDDGYLYRDDKMIKPLEGVDGKPIPFFKGFGARHQHRPA